MYLTGASIIVFWGITNDTVLLMRHISLGNPDPAFFGIMIFTNGILLIIMAVTRFQETSYEIITNVGNLCVHNLDPYAIRDPILECYELPKEEVMALKKARAEMKKEETYPRRYNALTEVALYSDGGSKTFGIQGLRPPFNGRVILVCNPEMLIQNGETIICLAWVEVFHGLDQMENVPPHILKTVYDTYPRFKPGKFTILYGTEPLPQSVRAFNLRSKEWVYSLPVEASEISSAYRLKWLDIEIAEERKLVTDGQAELKFWDILEKKTEKREELENLQEGAAQ